MKKLSLILIMMTLLGCAHVISKEIRGKADKGVDTEAVLKDPESYKGKFIILGGVIISSRNTDEGTYLEVLERPLDSLERPEATDKSRGRFIILHEGYLDSAVYSKGREITVAGEVMGKMVRPLGEMEYPYLLIKSKELHLIEPRGGLPIRFEIGVFHTF